MSAQTESSAAKRTRSSTSTSQGCSVLGHSGHFEDEGDIQGGAPAGVADILASGRPDCVVGERAQAGDDVGVLADAGSVLGEGGVAHVLTAVLDAPVTPDPLVPALRRLAGSRGNPEDGLVLLLAKSGLGIALADRALQPEHGLDEAVPRRTAEPRLGRKNRQFAGLPAIAAGSHAFGRSARLAARRSQFELASQARLVAFDLGQQMIA